MGFPPGIAESMTYSYFKRYQDVHQKRFPPKPETKKRWDEYEKQQKEKQAKEKELAICKINYGVYIGCVVRSKEGVNYKIAVIEPYFKSKPSMKGYKQKKDGSYGNVANYIYDGWVLVA